MDYFHLSEDKQDILNMSSLGLAYLGDAVYEVMVRSWLCLRGKLTPGALHRSALDYVAAPRQAALLEKLLPVLRPEETQVFKRGRNANPHSHPRGATRREYQVATGLEALFGWLYLRGETGRLNELFEMMMEGEDMPMDALCLSAVCREVEPAVLGGRIDKIYQPSRDEILLQIRGRAGSCRLLLSANPSRPRLQLTDLPRENPAEPPMFCMLLRKYLAGGKILALRQPPMERLAELVVEAANEMGDKVRRRLVLEAMGRRTNLLLLDGEDRIVDCLRRVEGDLTQARPLLPGMFYQYPAPQPGKKNPGALTPADRAELLALGQGAGPADRFLLDHCMGLSPLLVQEIFDIIRNIHKEGMTILLVEQNAQMALSVADRAYVLETGRVVMDGTGAELLTNERVRSAYLGG